MDASIISSLTKNFEEYVFEEDGTEFWFARNLQILLGYNEWRNFLGVIDKAKESCKQAGFDVLNHFVGVNKMIALPKV